MITKPYVTLALLATTAALLVGCCAQPVATMAPEPTSALEQVYVTQVIQEEAEYGAIAPAPTLAPPNDEPYKDVFFEDYGVNPFIDTEDDYLSTFAIDVDTGSYTVMRRYISDGYLPDDDSVRVEEYINYFDQGYEPPGENDGAFAIHIYGAPSRFGEERYHLARIGIQGYEVSPEERKDVVLTFVIDISGSMDMENRLELVKDALQLLVSELRPSDSVGIVVYGSRARIVLEHTAVGEDYERILDAIYRLSPDGSTNAEEGLVLGYRMAAETYDPEAINRVILCSDGVANVGRTGPDSIMEQISTYADEGIYLTTVGFGMGNYNDVLMEQLADQGDGFYAYVDDIKEAERVFVHQLTSTLQVIAKDAKVQVEFNPSAVSRYRLIGYENRDVADEDFRDDSVDGGEIGAGHAVTALYELKFQPDAPENEVAFTVFVRYQKPDSGEAIEISRAVAQADFTATFGEAAPRFQLAAVVAEYAEVLRNSYWAKGSSLEDVAREAHRVAEYLPGDEDVAEFVSLVDRAASLSE
jgi:Ca-activated chloride channel family protein